MNKLAKQEMLTRTYTSVALSHEQKNARQVLARLMARLQDARRSAADAKSKSVALHEFAAAERYYHDRAIEKHVIPAIRESIAEANLLLNELEALSASSAGILRRMQEPQPAQTQQAEQAMLSAMEQYCHQLNQRLGKEEGELIPLAFRALTPEEWFAIAVKCLPAEERKAA